MAQAPIDRQPGYRRRLLVTPDPARTRCDLEDDFHQMGVIVHHRDGIATTVEAIIVRAPWTTCPAATAQLASTFRDVPLDAFARHGQKSLNCTHLFDMAQLAAAHAHDLKPSIYDIIVADAVDGLRLAELHRDGALILRWTLRGLQIVAPTPVAGLTLGSMREHIDALPETDREPVRLLRWAALVARGRDFTWASSSETQIVDPVCYTFQPQRRPIARRASTIKDFGPGLLEPLADRPTDAL
jgi:hypothetical protein